MQSERRRIDQVKDAEFLDNITAIPIDELRSRRDLAEEVETELSYYRRLLHGRLDVLAFEQRRRRGEEDRSLIDALTEILTGHDNPRPGQPAGAGTGRHLTIELPDFPLQGRRHLDRILGNDLMIRLGEMSEDELIEAREELASLESEISAYRVEVQAILDRLQAEVVHRYKTELGDSPLRQT
ncbi:hypothetical protein BH18ACT6_BH18ACT6_17630 [soil metagenome]|nr:hypothetical protein [Actinomycetota bacterium]